MSLDNFNTLKVREDRNRAASLEGGSSLNFMTLGGRRILSSFTRSSIAWKNGVSIPANTPRIYGMNTKAPVVLMEGTRTNLLTDAANMTSYVAGSYGPVGSIDVSQSTKYNGIYDIKWSVPATFNSATNTRYNLRFACAATWGTLNLTPNKTQAYCWSFEIKFLQSGMTGSLVMKGGVVDDATPYSEKLMADFSNSGTFVARSGCSVTTTALADGYIRVSVVILPSFMAGTGTTCNVAIWVNTPSFDTQYNILFRKPQFELGGNPSSFIPTTGSAVTRSADLWTALGISDKLKQGKPFTISMAVRISNPPATNTYPALAYWTLNGKIDRFPVFIGPSAPYAVAVDPRDSVNGLNFSLSGSSNTTLNSWVVIHIVSDGTNAYFYTQGGLRSQKVPWTLQWEGYNYFSIGSNSTTSNLFGYIGVGAPALGIPFIRNTAITASQAASESAKWLAELALINDLET